MKSQKILIRNLPYDGEKKRKKIAVKPTFALGVALACGFGMLFLNRPYTFVGAILMLVVVFCLAVLPDRTLIEFSKDWMILCNQPDKNECYLIYYDDIVSWQYDYQKQFDQLVIHLVDGSGESIAVFSKFFIKKYLKKYAPGKEKKSTRNKG